MEGKFPNGCAFFTDQRGRKVDEDGFVVSKHTYITNRRTCVSVKINDDRVQIRDTKDESKTTLSFSRDEWDSFIKGVKDGDFDL